MSAFLTDGLVSLRTIRRADLPQLAIWRNEPEMRAKVREWRPLTDVDQERWYERISGPNRTDFMFAVVSQGGRDVAYAVSGIMVGVVGLCHWDAINGTAEVSYYLGAEWARGQGYAKRALTLLFDWGFETMRLERIWAEIYEGNGASGYVAESLGFVHEGTLRKHVHKNGQRIDAHLYGLLASEWKAAQHG